MGRWRTDKNRNRGIGVAVNTAERDLFRAAAILEVAHVPGATLSVSSWLRNQGMRRVQEIVRVRFLTLLVARAERERLLRWSRGHQRRMERRRWRIRLVTLLASYRQRTTWRGL